MYRLKNNIKFEELENFGFKKYNFPGIGETEYRRYYDFDFPNAVSSFDEATKTIENWNDDFNNFNIPSDEELLKDLIEANIIIKITDK